MTFQLDSALLSPPLVQGDSCLTGKFRAMGSPCEILIDSLDPVIGRERFDVCVREANRIEKKFSRYQKGNAVDEINTSDGKRILVDDETALLLDFAQSCFELSQGLFDVTTGILRRVWEFQGRAQNINDSAIKELLAFIGWNKITWRRPFLEVPRGMEIDLGGICKEYATDRILSLLSESSSPSVLVNLGGDIAAHGDRLWVVGIEDVNRLGTVSQTVSLGQGAMATSGTLRRFTLVDGKKYAHILDPRTGWPVQNSPQSVTVASSTCTEAGFFSTLALLHGANAETFLREQAVRFWCTR